jgi:hypothetical protein
MRVVRFRRVGHRRLSRLFSALCLAALLGACDDTSDDGRAPGPSGPAPGTGTTQGGDAGENDAARGFGRLDGGNAGAGGHAGSSAGQAGNGGATGRAGSGVAGGTGGGQAGQGGPGQMCEPAGGSCFNSLASCCAGLICCSSVPCSDFVGTCQTSCCPP